MTLKHFRDPRAKSPGVQPFPVVFWVGTCKRVEIGITPSLRPQGRKMP